MAMHESEAFWQEFLRRPSAQRAVQLEQKVMMKDAARDLTEKEDKEKEQLAEALAACEPEVRQLAQQMQSSARVKRLLFRLLQESKFDSQEFSKRLAPDQPAYKHLLSLREELIESAAAWNAQLQQVREQCETAVGLSTYEPIKPRTWEELPEDELAERLCKGEICPRDEWVPGLSKDKRPLDSPALKQHLQLGDLMLSDGRTAYAEEKYDTALMRFTQGVQLLNWVRAADSEEQHLIDDMYLIFLRNQAQTALKLEKYQECLRACTTIIQDLDEHDAKARYRRAKAYTLLGLVKSAKDDLIFMVKSPFMEAGAVVAARAALADLRKIVSKSETQARQTMMKSVTVFSENRPAPASSDDTNSNNETDSIDSSNNKTDNTSTKGKAAASASCGINGESESAHVEQRKKYFFEEEDRSAKESGGGSSQRSTNQAETKRRVFFEELDSPSADQSPNKDATHMQKTEKRQALRSAASGRRQGWFQKIEQDESSPQADNTQENGDPAENEVQRTSSKKEAAPPPLDVEQTKLLLVDLLEVYTSAETQKQLQQMARDSDFEVRRFLVRLKKFLPQLQEEVFERNNVPGSSHRLRLRAMEQSVAFWRSEDEEVEMLRKECWAAVFGDVLDID